MRALFDAAAADESVARALVARRHPVIEEFGQAQKTEGHRSGNIEGYRKALRRVLAQRGLEPDARQRARLEACEDLDLLDVWLCRALTAARTDEIFL